MDPEMMTTAKIAPMPPGPTGEHREELTLPGAARILAPAIAVRRRFYAATGCNGFRAWTVAANVGRAMEALAMLDLADVSKVTILEIPLDEAREIRLKGDADHPEHTTLATAPIGAVYSTAGTGLYGLSRIAWSMTPSNPRAALWMWHVDNHRSDMGEAIAAAYHPHRSPDAAVDLAAAEPCAHASAHRGADIPRVHGSYRSEVCDACGAFRARDHHDAIIAGHNGGWRSATEYADATSTDED